MNETNNNQDPKENKSPQNDLIATNLNVDSMTNNAGKDIINSEEHNTSTENDKIDLNNEEAEKAIKTTEKQNTINSLNEQIEVEDHKTLADISTFKTEEKNNLNDKKGQKLLFIWQNISNYLKKIISFDDLFVKVLSWLGFRLRPQKALQRAHRLAHRKKWAQAEESYLEVLALRPLNLEAYDGLGNVYYQQEMIEKANLEFTVSATLEALLLNRDDLISAATLAEALITRNTPMHAVTLLEPILVAHFFSSQNNLLLLKAMSKAYQKVAQHTKEKQVYNAGIKQHPQEAFFYMGQAQICKKLGQLEESKKLLEIGALLTQTKLFPNDPQAFISLSKIYLKENKLSENLDLVKKALEINPKNLQLNLSLFKTYQQQGNYELALQTLLEIDKLENNAHSKSLLASFYQQQGDLKKALEMYKSLSKKEPRNPEHSFNISSIFNKLGEPEKANKYQELAETLKCGLIPEPNHRQTVRFIKYLYQTNNIEEANQWLKKGLEKWPNSGELILSEVKLLYRKKQYKKALELIKKLLSIHSESAEARMWLALCQQNLGKHMAAVSEAQIAVRLAPKSYTAHKVLGDILKEQKKYSPANAAYEAAALLRLNSLKRKKLN